MKPSPFDSAPDKPVVVGFLQALAVGLATVAVQPVHAQIVYVDKAAENGTIGPGYGRASAMVDLDGDGLLDLIAANFAADNFFYRQLPDRTFALVNEEWGIAADARLTMGVFAADFDDDGDLDVYFVNGSSRVAQQNKLLRNDLSTGGGFVDVTAQSGDAALATKSFGGSVIDYDGDRDLDLFLTDSDPARPNMLLRNDGGLSFTDVSQAAGIAHPGFFWFGGAGDINNDGWTDLAAGNMTGPSVVYRNNGDGSFSEVAGAVAEESPRDNFGAVLDDFDNDGWMDIYLAKYQLDPPPGPSLLFLNNGDGTFRNVTEGSGMTGQSDMGHNVSDADADGYPDIFIGTGGSTFTDFDNLFLIHPNGQGGLIATDVSEASGILAAGETRQHGHAFGDYDDDGDLDVFVNNGGGPVFPESLEENYFWVNQGNGNKWIAFDLRGVASNRNAVGARGAVLGASGQAVYRFQSVGKGFANTDDTTMHFGLGLEGNVRMAVIRWPSGISQLIPAPAVGQVHPVLETGIIGGDTAEFGGIYEINFVGTPGHEASLMASTSAELISLPIANDVGALTPPISTLVTVTLDSAGLGGVEVPLDDPNLAGQTIKFQALFSPPGAPSPADGSRSNVLSVTIQ